MAVPWTFFAAGEVAERWDFLTDVLPPPTGEEQRRSLRLSPRIVQQFDSLESAARRRWMETALIANGAGDWDVPFVQDASPLTAAANDGDTSISLDTTLRRFFAGSRALVMQQDHRVYEVRTIQSVASGSLTLTAGLDRDWPIGTRVIPLFEGKLASAPSLERYTSDDVPVRLEFQLTDAIDWPATAGAATYRTLPVLELRPDWSSSPEFSPERRLAIVDNDTGVPTWYDQPGIPFSLQRAGFTLVGRQAICDFWSLLYALAGRWGPVWVPSLANDLVPAAGLTTDSTTLDVDRVGLADWPLKANRRDIRIALANGTILYRRIVGVLALDDNTERLTLDSDLGVTAAADDVAQISFMALCRQDTDTNLLRWWSDGVVLAEMSLRAYLHDL